MKPLLVLFAILSTSAFATPDDPVQSWKRAVQRKSEREVLAIETRADEIKMQAKATRLERAFQLAAQATGEPAQNFTYKCMNDCTLKNSGTATYYMRIALQSRSKVCVYNAFNDDMENANPAAMSCLDRVR